MKKFTVTFITVLFVLSALPVVAAEQLIVNGTFPSTVSGETRAAEFELALPTTVVLGANTEVKWGVLPPTIENEVGDKNNQQAFEGLIAGEIVPLGRRATFSISSPIAIKMTFVFWASVDSKVFQLQKEIEFKESTNGSIGRKKLPKLPSDFRVEIDNPNPGEDEVVTLRARYRWTGDLKGSLNPFTWLASNGETVEQSSNNWPKKDEWTTFEVSAKQYLQSGFVLGANWVIDGGGSFIYFQRKIPIEIEFSPKYRKIDEFSWRFEDETEGPVDIYYFKESGESSGGIKFEAQVDWSKVDKSISCVNVKWTLQHKKDGKWVNEPGDWLPTGGQANWGDYCRHWESTVFEGRLSIWAAHEDEPWPSETRTYRIWSTYQQKSVAQFKVVFIPNPNAKKVVNVKVDFPQIVEYGKKYKAVATVNPKFSGNCSFYTFFFRDVFVGKSKIVGGKASLSFRVLWPKDSSSRKSLKAVCSGGKYEGTGWAVFLGTNK